MINIEIMCLRPNIDKSRSMLELDLSEIYDEGKSY